MGPEDPAAAQDALSKELGHSTQGQGTHQEESWRPTPPPPPPPLTTQSSMISQKPTDEAQRRRSGWTRPLKSRGNVPMYPWGSAWQFSCHISDLRPVIRSKGNFEQHMRDIHGHPNSQVMDVSEDHENWLGLLDVADEENRIFAEMVFDEGYTKKHTNTGQKPPKRLDAAYKRENGEDMKIRDRMYPGDVTWLRGAYGGAVGVTRGGELDGSEKVEVDHRTAGDSGY